MAVVIAPTSTAGTALRALEEIQETLARPCSMGNVRKLERTLGFYGEPACVPPTVPLLARAHAHPCRRHRHHFPPMPLVQAAQVHMLRHMLLRAPLN